MSWHCSVRILRRSGAISPSTVPSPCCARGAYGGGDAAHRVFGLGGGDGDRLQAAVGKDRSEQADDQAVRAVRQEAAVPGEVGGARGIRARQHAEDRESAQQHEEGDRCDLQGREPELELTEVAHRRPVRAAEGGHEQQAPHPRRGLREPAGHDGGGPIASAATPTHSSVENIQPAVKPAQGPIARSACTENDPEADGRGRCRQRVTALSRWFRRSPPWCVRRRRRRARRRPGRRCPPCPRPVGPGPAEPTRLPAPC